MVRQAWMPPRIIRIRIGHINHLARHRGKREGGGGRGKERKRCGPVKKVDSNQVAKEPSGDGASLQTQAQAYQRGLRRVEGSYAHARKQLPWELAVLVLLVNTPERIYCFAGSQHDL